MTNRDIQVVFIM